MLREFAASLRGRVVVPVAVLAIAAPALAGCGIKGPLRLPPSAPAASASPPASSGTSAPASALSPAPAPSPAPASTPAATPEDTSAPREPAGRKP